MWNETTELEWEYSFWHNYEERHNSKWLQSRIIWFSYNLRQKELEQSNNGTVSGYHIIGGSAANDILKLLHMHFYSIKQKYIMF